MKIEKNDQKIYNGEILLTLIKNDFLFMLWSQCTMGKRLKYQKDK